MTKNGQRTRMVSWRDIPPRLWVDHLMCGIRPKPARVGNERITDEFRLFRNRGVAAVGNDHDRNAVTQGALEFMRILDMSERIMVWLQIEDRCAPGRIVGLTRGPIAGDPLRCQYLRVPARKPRSCVVTGRKERKLQGLEAGRIG